MLGTVLKLLKPSYALTALLLFGAWQGYSFVKSVPERLHLPFGVEQAQTEKQTELVEAKQEQAEQMPQNRTVAAIQRIHPAMRILSWIVIYVLLCFATVPVIKKMLAKESNLVNAILIGVYSSVGLFLALIFTAFQFSLLSAIMLIAALVFSAGIIIKLASELEKIRVQDSFG